MLWFYFKAGFAFASGMLAVAVCVTLPLMLRERYQASRRIDAGLWG